MLVAALMNKKPVKLDQAIELKTAIPLMSDALSSSIIVIDDKQPVGILTDRDIASLFAGFIRGTCDINRPLSEVMTTDPVCVTENTSFKDALMLSKSRKLRNLPVINESGALVGLVSQTSLIDAYATLVEHQDELENSVEELQLLSLEDPLLKIGNRRAMEVDLTHTEADAKRHNKTYAVALMDVDHFKDFNDTYGHQKGDEALSLIAQTIKKTVRTSDRVFRYGGEEILILMPETNQKKAFNCAERVRKAVESLGIPHAKSAHSHLTVSAGFASEEKGRWVDLVTRADKSLYQSKNEGRNKTTAG